MGIIFERILQNKFRVILMGIILFFPCLEIIFYLYNIMEIGDCVYVPDFSFFLTGNSVGVQHVLQSLFFWFMPLYCLVIASSDCMEDYALGYKNVLISKMGYKKYVRSHLVKSFCVSFLLVAVSLLINLLMVHIVFAGGLFVTESTELVESSFILWEINHPFLANLLFTFFAASAAGLISMAGTMLGITLHNKKLVYGITMLLWMIPSLQDNSLMNLFQPHSEYGLSSIIPLAVEMVVLCLGVVVAGYIKEVRFET